MKRIMLILKMDLFRNHPCPSDLSVPSVARPQPFFLSFVTFCSHFSIT